MFNDEKMLKRSAKIARKSLLLAREMESWMDEQERERERRNVPYDNGLLIN